MSPISNASKLAEFGSGIGTAGAVLQVDNTNKRIGIGTTNPQSVFQVGTGVSVYGDVGIVSCTEVRADTLRGDGTNITGVVGVGTLNVRTETVTTSGVSTFAGVTKVTNTTDTTSTTTGALIISGGVGIAKSLHVGQNITIGGTLTYEDVTNVDSIGLITARSGVNVTGGQIQVGAAFSVGNAGVATAAGFVGPLTGNVTGSQSGGSVSATTGTFSQKTTVNATLEATEGLNVTAGISTLRGELKLTEGTSNVSNGDEIGSLMFIYPSNNNNNAKITALQTTGTSGADLAFFTRTQGDGTNTDGGEERLRIASDGAVGVGTTNPATNFKLTVEGDLSIGENNGTDNSYIDQRQNGQLDIINSGRNEDNASVRINRYNNIAGSTTKFRDFVVYNGKNSEVLVVDGSTSRVGIGTDNPAGKLEIDTASSTTMIMLDVAGTNFARLGHNSSGGTALLDVRSEGHIRCLTGGNNERIRVTSGGLVGINESSSIDAHLHVNSGTDNTTLFLESTDSDVNIGMADNSGSCRLLQENGNLRFRTGGNSNAFGTGDNERMVINNLGYLGIGLTNPTANLDCYHANNNTIVNIKSGDAGAYLQAQDDTGAGIFGQNGATTVISCDPADSVGSSAIVFQVDANSEKVRIDASGRIGIGTANPASQLSIYGGDASIRLFDTSGGTSSAYRIMAYNGINYIQSGQEFSSDSSADFVFSTMFGATEHLRIKANGGLDLVGNAQLLERVKITAGKLSDNTNIDLDNGMVHYFTTQESTTCTPNIRIDGSNTLQNAMATGQVCTVTLVTTAAAGGYSAHVTIDGNAVTEEWVGGSAPDAGGDDGLDIYSYTIICIGTGTGDSGFKVIGNKINATN